MKKITLSTSSKKGGRRPRITLQIPPGVNSKYYRALFTIYCDIESYNLEKDFTTGFLDKLKEIKEAKTLNYDESILANKKNREVSNMYSLMQKRNLD